MTLRDLSPWDEAIIDVINSDGTEVQDGFKIRLEALGLVPSKPVLVLRGAAFGGPLHVRVSSTTEVAIRRSEAERVQIREHQPGTGRHLGHRRRRHRAGPGEGPSAQAHTTRSDA
ncbi:FeoA family protein [Halochromatium sp.]